MTKDVMLNEAIEAIRKGQRARARDLLTRLLRVDQSNPQYWLWMSSLVDSFKEQVYCLRTALRLDPDNQAAKKGLILIGAEPPDESVVPAPLIRRHWEVEVREVPKQKIWQNPVVRIAVYTLAGVIVIGLIALGISGISTRRTQTAVIIPTKTLGPSPTYTDTPTPINFTPFSHTNTPRITNPPPLWTFLDATYTPTSIYVNTPHPINEAYRVAQRALARSDLEIALISFQQAAAMSPDSPDIAYYIGEVYRFSGDDGKALQAYNDALKIDASFAPAYLGKARLKLASGQDTGVLEDLQQAVEYDPDFGEAYLEMATYLLTQGEVEFALKKLELAGESLPDSPLVLLYLAQVYIELGEVNQALEYAQKANELDITLLLAYRIIGEAAAIIGDHQAAMEALNTYLDYEQGDAVAWMTLGKAYYISGQFEESLDALETAFNLDPNLGEIYLYQGLVFLELGEGQKAINEIYEGLKLDPNSFNLNLQFARALLLAGRIDDARGTIYRTELRAETDEQLAQVYYWRATILEARGETYLALRDWQRLLDLPDEAVPEEWLEIAQLHLETTSTPAPGVTPTPSPSRTPTPSRTTSPSTTMTQIKSSPSP